MFVVEAKVVVSVQIDIVRVGRRGHGTWLRQRRLNHLWGHGDVRGDSHWREGVNFIEEEQKVETMTKTENKSGGYVDIKNEQRQHALMVEGVRTSTGSAICTSNLAMVRWGCRGSQ